MDGEAVDGATVFRHASKIGLEGIVSKPVSAAYLRPIAGLDQGQERGQPGDAPASGGQPIAERSTLRGDWPFGVRSASGALEACAAFDGGQRRPPNWKSGLRLFVTCAPPQTEGRAK